jgi:hypothetical protein
MREALEALGELPEYDADRPGFALGGPPPLELRPPHNPLRQPQQSSRGAREEASEADVALGEVDEEAAAGPYHRAVADQLAVQERVARLSMAKSFAQSAIDKYLASHREESDDEKIQMEEADEERVRRFQDAEDARRREEQQIAASVEAKAQKNEQIRAEDLAVAERVALRARARDIEDEKRREWLRAENDLARKVAEAKRRRLERQHAAQQRRNELERKYEDQERGEAGQGKGETDEQARSKEGRAADEQARVREDEHNKRTLLAAKVREEHVRHHAEMRRLLRARIVPALLLLCVLVIVLAVVLTR